MNPTSQFDPLPDVSSSVTALAEATAALASTSTTPADTPPDAHAPRSAAAASLIRSSDWNALLADVATSETGVKAAEVIVQRILQWFPDHTIRMAWGDSKSQSDGPEFLVDAKLGCLDENNPLHLRVTKTWDAEESEADALRPPARLEPHGLVIEMRARTDAGASGSTGAESTAAKASTWRGRIWVTPPLGPAGQLQVHAKSMQSWVRQLDRDSIEALTAVFRSRPRHHWWMRWIERVSAWWAWRRLIGVGCALLIALMLFPAPYRVRAGVTVRARDARVVAAPFESTLLTSNAQPGDLVSRGQVLLELDGRPLRIELQGVTAELDQAIKDEDIALVNGEIAKAQLAGLRRQNALQRRELLQSRLDQLTLRSPIDGIVIRGDLQRHLGSTLSLGQTLIEVAPQGSVEMELEIPEVEIGFVGSDSDVRLWFPALGGDAFATDITSMWPAATIREEKNVFIARASMPADDVAHGALRVGMRGEAVIRGPLRPWSWAWIRTPVRRVMWMLGW